MELSYFGKLPTRADFVRRNAAGPAVRSMDAWIQDGLRFMQSQSVFAADGVYDNACVSSFYLRRPGDQIALAGAIRPSRDQSGRKYPFFIAAELDPSQGLPASRIPSAFSKLFGRCSTFVNDAVEGRLDTDGLDAGMDALDDIVIQPVQGSETADDSFSSTTFRELCRGLWDGFSDTRKYAAFKHLLDALLPERGKGAPSLAYGLQFPVARGPLAETSVLFWLEVTSRLLAQRDLAASLFWSLGASETQAGPSLYVYFDRVPASGFTALLQSHEDVDSLYRIEAVGRENAALMALSIPEQYGRLIENGDLALNEFLTALS